jgi:hypothetical protein
VSFVNGPLHCVAKKKNWQGEKHLAAVEFIKFHFKCLRLIRFTIDSSLSKSVFPEAIKLSTASLVLNNINIFRRVRLFDKSLGGGERGER